MSTIKYRVASEVRKAVHGEETKVPVSELFHWIAKDWLEMRKAGHSGAMVKVTSIRPDRNPDVTELERMFRLQDPRR